MDTEELKPLSSTEDIAPDGDVVLVVGEEQMRLRVYSQCLRAASKVFNVMFGSDWSEGQGLSDQSPREVPLVEDDADTMRLACLVIHHRNSDVPDALAPLQVLQLGILADKYDLVVALKYARASWLEPKGEEGSVSMGYLMAAAFLFCDMNAFAARSLDLILRYAGSYMPLLDDKNINEVVPPKAFYLMEERRASMRADVGQLLLDWSEAACSCGWRKKHAEKCGLLRSNYGPLGMIQVPLLKVIDEMKAVPTEDLGLTFHAGDWGGDRYTHQAPAYKDTLLGRLERMEKKASVCLDCVRVRGDNKPCGFQHG